MADDGVAFYDNPAVFDTYMAHRHRSESPNDIIEWPILLEMIGDLAGERVLDLGCGDADLGRKAIDQGCRSYLGLEGSANMYRAAQEKLAGSPATLVHTRIESWDYPVAQFDLAVSRLALHYLEDVAPVFAAVYRALVPGGRFVFSVEHPVITSSDEGWRGQGQRQAWVVDDYFNTGRRVTPWLGGEVVKYHRTVEDYFLAMQKAGFVVESLRESRPQRAFFENEETFVRRQRIPLYLFLAGSKGRETDGQAGDG